MKIEKRLLIYGLISVLVGTTSIAPLAFLMSTKAETMPKPWFNVEVPYAYCCVSENSTTECLNLREDHVIVLNFTFNDGKDISDARLEYFRIEVYSDKGPIMNMLYFVGTSRAQDFEFNVTDFHFMRKGWFDTNDTRGGSGGVFAYCWNEQGSILTRLSGSSGGTTPSGEKTVSVLTEAETIFIDIRRLGYVTFKGNSTVVDLASSEVIQHIQLKKFGNGFLYNTIFSEDELSEIDLLNPPLQPFKK